MLNRLDILAVARVWRLSRATNKHNPQHIMRNQAMNLMNSENL